MTLDLGFMDAAGEIDLSELGRTAAARVYGPERVKNIKVKTGEDFTGRPTHFFSFLIDQDRSGTKVGMLHIRLIQELRDELMAHNDDHYPFTRVFDRADWDKVEGA